MKITFEQVVAMHSDVMPEQGDDTDYASMAWSEWWKKEMGQSVVDQVKEAEHGIEMHIEEFGYHPEEADPDAYAAYAGPYGYVS